MIKKILFSVLITVAFAQDIECPVGFIPIPANPEMGTYCDFCVSKYEMKIVGVEDGNVEYNSSFVAESRADGTPWRNCTQVQAKNECEALGEGYAMITNAQWQTIARNIESVSSNWSDNSTHLTGTTTAKLNIGHSCRKGTLGIDCRVDAVAYSGEALAASTDDSDGCYGYICGDYEDEAPTLNSNGWNLYRRTFYLSNDQVIWDFSGNLWNWIDYYIPLAADRARIDGVIDNEYLEINLAEPMSDDMLAIDYKSHNTDMTGTINQNCLGRYHPTEIDYFAGVAMKGGNFMHGMYNSGIYALGMGYGPDPDHLECRIGFRCVYIPEDAVSIESEQNKTFIEIPTVSPNPFNTSTMIEYSVPENYTGNIKIILTDCNGRVIKKLLDQKQVAGKHELILHANTLSSGNYYVIYSGDYFSNSKKITVLK